MDVMKRLAAAAVVPVVVLENAADAVPCAKAMLASAKTKVLLCDSSKIGKKFAYRGFGFEEIDYVVTDKPLPEEILLKFPLDLISDTRAFVYKNTERCEAPSMARLI